MKIIILGADGYLGWPTCMHFSEQGHDVLGVDNYFQRNASLTLDCESLVPVPNLLQRAKIWKEVSGKNIAVRIGDVADYGFLLSLFNEFRPDAVIHYAEQPSAPYSM